MTAGLTVSSLSATLRSALMPVGNQRLPDTVISAVHISELLDPSPYLTGGELLMTLGMALPMDRVECRRYVACLRKSQVSALALGLGPVYDEVPGVLAAACAEQGLPLLVVPDRTPFLTVTKAYWNALARSSERHLNDAIATHRALVDAAASVDPVAAVLRKLATWLDGWAATLDVSGKLVQIHPAGFQDEAEALEAEVERLEVAGVHSAASFGMAGSTVVVFPLVVGSDVAGYLAIGTEVQLEASQRAVVLGACGLLSLDANRSISLVSAQAARRQGVAMLLEDGHLEAAQQLSARLGLAPLQRECRVITLQARDAEGLEAVVLGWCPDAVGVSVTRQSAWFVVPAVHPELSALVDLLRRADPSTSGIISELLKQADIGQVRARQAQRVLRLGRRELVQPVESVDTVALGARLDELASAGGEAVVSAFAGYLRARGQWEQAARSLGVHRNTLRYRVSRAREILGVDLDNADVTARLWLMMRDRGLA